MSAPSLVQSLSPATPADAVERAQLSEIDASNRTPAIFFLVSSVVWLMVGTLLAIIASFKMHDPYFANGLGEFFTFGRARAAHLNAVIYGWCNNVIFMVAPWLMTRLSRTKLRHGGLLIIGGIFWNLGVTLGILGILGGQSTSVEWLEMPTTVTPLLAVAYGMIGVWGIVAFRFRRSGHVYVSQWYILAALFWLPWLYIVAQIMILFEPARGVVQALTNWWFAHNVLGLWLTPMGLAAAYYFIPKVLGKPIHSYYLSLVGFWTLALFYNWAGVHHLIGGPIPAWLISAGTVASVMMVIPVVVTGINHHMTVKGSFSDVWCSPTLRFIVFGAMMYTLVSLAGSTMALRSVNEITHFTHFTVGHAHHGVYAFFTMIMFGAVYYIVPRLLKREWPSAVLIKTHFWFTAVGIIVMLVALHVGGLVQGLQMNDFETYPNFSEIVMNTSNWLFLRSISGILITVGHFAFFLNVAWMVFLRFGQKDWEGSPTLLQTKTSTAG